MFKIFQPTLVILINTSYLCSCNIEFNRSITGVTFNPAVKSHQNNDHTGYSFNEVKTMLKVISAKFSNIATTHAGAPNSHARYIEKVTYFESLSLVLIPEAAAELNYEESEAANITKLKVLIGISNSYEPTKTHTEVNLALESAKRSINIFPGTCTGFYFRNIDISNITQILHTLSQLRRIRPKSKKLNLTLGTLQSCNGLKDIINLSKNITDVLTETRREILKLSDFIICQFYTNSYYTDIPSKVINSFSRKFLGIRETIRLINPNTKFMVESRVSSAGFTDDSNQNFVEVWKLLDEWGSKHDVPIWMYEAIDNPWKNKTGPLFPHMGWWKLSNDDATNRVDGYVEKAIGRKGYINTINSSIESSVGAWTYIGVPLGIVVVLALFAVLFIHCRKINKIYDILSPVEVQEFFQGISERNHLAAELEVYSESVPIQANVLSSPYDKSIEISKNNFEILWSVILGLGEFGCVYKAFILVPSENCKIAVALKMTRDDCQKTAVKSLLSEIKILTYLGYHPNLVSIKGAYTAEIGKGIVYVATELCDLGSLKNFLRQQVKAFKINRDKTGADISPSVEFNDLIRWSYEIACGMEYLEEKQVVHADLATRNVLLTSEKTAKITDFGLSRRLYGYTNYVKKQQEPLPWRWMALEALKKLEFSTQSDVWSFGVTLWEIFSMGDVPYPGLSWSMDFVSNLERGLRMNIPARANQQIYKLMSCCWEMEPQDRPTFSQLRQSFVQIIEISKSK